MSIWWKGCGLTKPSWSLKSNISYSLLLYFKNTLCDYNAWIALSTLHFSTCQRTKLRRMNWTWTELYRHVFLCTLFLFKDYSHYMKVLKSNKMLTSWHKGNSMKNLVAPTFCKKLAWSPGWCLIVDRCHTANIKDYGLMEIRKNTPKHRVYMFSWPDNKLQTFNYKNSLILLQPYTQLKHSHKAS